MNQTEILAILLAAGGWVVAILQAALGFLERKKEKNDAILLKTVDYFTGGSQKRSVGIALVEGFIRKKGTYHEIVAPLLSNQFVYLLLSSDSDSAVHEERNLIRVFNLLDAITVTDKYKFSAIRNEMAAAIARRLEGSEKSSLNIEASTLEIWKKRIA